MQKATRSDSFVEASIPEQRRDHFAGESVIGRQLREPGFSLQPVSVPALVSADSDVGRRILLAGGSRLALDSCALSCRERLQRECGPLRSVALLHHGAVFLIGSRLRRRH